jgi:ATP-dependent DNA helicase RecQ
MAVNDDELLKMLGRFGHDHFRPGQLRVIRALLARRDVLALLPTGAGKSLAYQLASQLLPGTTVVVSPLIALMKDQVESLGEVGVPAAVLSGSLSRRRLETTLGRLAAGEVKLLYLTPERFEDEGFVARLRELQVSLFVVDEAHCISEWGHSFRPAYLALPAAITALGRPPVLALTATATPWVRDEITGRLGLSGPELVVRGTDRPNLFFEVRRVEDEQDDRRVLERLLSGSCDEYPDSVCDDLRAAMEGSGIVYAATTAGAREAAEWLRAMGIAADYYHGRRPKSERDRVQDAFMAGDVRVICATNAFGLGVDKPDVRFVIHRDVPASLEAYYQEAGRAGRDGAFARCALIYRPGDLGRAAFLSAGGQLTREEVHRARPALLANPRATLRELEAATGLGRADVIRLAAALVHDGIAAERRGRLHLRRRDFDPDSVTLDMEERRHAYERSRFEMMRAYAEGQGCRRKTMLSYFGEDYRAERCERCDNDLPRDGDERVAIAAEPERVAHRAPFRPGARVTHAQWGEGTLQGVDGDSLTVLFESVGYKTLSAELVLSRGMLRAAA